MSDRNVFDAIQAELRPHYDSDDADSSEDEYVPSVSIQRKIFWKRIWESGQMNKKRVIQMRKCQHKLCLQWILPAKTEQHGDLHHLQQQEGNSITSFVLVPSLKTYQV